jgi:O-6-methylguanine DNA methyltransferase
VGLQLQMKSLALAIATADGEFLAHYSAAGLCALEFPAATRRAGRGEPAVVPPKIRVWHQTVAKALARALAGQPPGRLPPLDLSSGTDFQRRVWRALCAIAPGRTRSYAEVAAAVGQPRAARAVGGACGANPIPVFVPCHRVLAAHNALGGFSAGLKWKRLLLAREGIRVAPPPVSGAGARSPATSPAPPAD